MFDAEIAPLTSVKKVVDKEGDDSEKPVTLQQDEATAPTPPCKA